MENLVNFFYHPSLPRNLSSDFLYRYVNLEKVGLLNKGWVSSHLEQMDCCFRKRARHTVIAKLTD